MTRIITPEEEKKLIAYDDLVDRIKKVRQVINSKKSEVIAKENIVPLSEKKARLLAKITSEIQGFEIITQEVIYDPTIQSVVLKLVPNESWTQIQIEQDFNAKLGVNWKDYLDQAIEDTFFAVKTQLLTVLTEIILDELIKRKQKAKLKDFLDYYQEEAEKAVYQTEPRQSQIINLINQA